jgi:acyl-coenzyme A thioesterase PaaI-like protein
MPTAASVGPWGPTTVSGMTISGLVGYAAEQAAGDADFVGTRLTVDMIRMALMGELVTSATVLREGRRLRLVDVTVEQNGRSVAYGRAVFARRSTEPAGTVRSEPIDMPVPPTDVDWPTVGGGLAYSTPDSPPTQDFDIWRDTSLRKLVWFNLPIDLVEGEPMSPFTRAAGVADVGNPLTNWGSEGLQFVNSDVTMLLARLPESTAIGLAARDRQSADGVSVGAATMYDRLGPIGTCTVTALASEVQMRQPHRDLR